MKSQEILDRLHLECEFFLIAGNRQEALKSYDKMLEILTSPFLLAGKAKLLEILGRESEAIDNFCKALQMSDKDEKIRGEIIRLILSLDSSRQGILKALLRQSIQELPLTPSQGNSVPDHECQSTCTLCKNSNPPEKTELVERDVVVQDTVVIQDGENAHITHSALSVKPVPQITPITKVDRELQNYQSAKTVISTVDGKPDAPDSHRESSTLNGRTEVISKHNQDTPGTTTHPQSPQSPDQPKDGAGTRIFGRYQILKELGQGGMGIVYKALDRDMERIVALKLVRDGIASKQHSQRFLQEVKATARLQHPNIISIYDFGELPQYYFTMEYVNGKTLTEVIQEGIIKSKKAAQILQAICSGIHCAHQAKIIHRDLKPSNIMIEDDDNVKVMDFGLAKILESETGLSKSGDIVGTPIYMSPEQSQAKEVDERSDIYSIGAIGYEMITGHPLFEGESILDIMYKVTNTEPLRPRLINTDIHVDLETILLKCLEKSPAKRYQDIMQLSEDIQRYLTNKPILAKPQTITVRYVKWIRRNRELSMAITSIILAILSIFGYVIYQWTCQIDHIRSLNIIGDVARWDKAKVSYEKEAELQFKKAEALSKDFIIYSQWGYFCLLYGQYHDRNKYYREAIPKFEKALSLNSQDYNSIYYLSLIHDVLQNPKKADEYKSRLLKLAREFKPDNEFLHMTLGVDEIDKLKDAENEEQKKLHMQRAMPHFQNAIRYNPYLYCSFYAIGALYCEQKEFYAAEQALNRSLDIAPGYVRALETRGILYFDRGMGFYKVGYGKEANFYWDRAEVDFKQLGDIILNDKSGYYLTTNMISEYYYYRIKLCVLRKDEKGACDYWREALNGKYNLDKVRDDPDLLFLRNKS